MIEVSDLAVSRGDVSVLSSASLSVAPGEFVALVGPNGAGKTTLLQTINGVLDPTSGTVTVDGDDVTACSARELSRRVATVPQDTSVAFDFPVEQIVAMGRTPYRSRFGGNDYEADARHVDRALSRTGMAALRDRPIGAVSGGERQRALLARALAQDTPALVLDEPTGSLDINHQVATLELVSDLVADGKAVIAAIHDLDLAARFCDRLVLLADGTVRAAGPPEAVLDGEFLDGAFDTTTAVAADPVTGTPSVTAIGNREEQDLRVHVLGHGRPAARTIAVLRDAGVGVTAGPVPTGDVATETAKSRDVDVVTAPAFEGVAPSTRSRAAELVARADVTVLAAAGVDDATRTLARRAARLVVVSRTDAAVTAIEDRPGESDPDQPAPVHATPEDVVEAVETVVARAQVPADD